MARRSSTAAMMAQLTGTWAMPMPVATIDSPSATSTISPWRSAKCLADASRQFVPDRIVPT
jgi:hypothetical protein